MLIAASVIPLVVDTGRILALDVSEKDREIQEALDEVRVLVPSSPFTFASNPIIYSSKKVKIDI